VLTNLQAQIRGVTDAEMPGIMVHETELDIFVLDDKGPDIMESDTRPLV
jgi:hypothetical protein